MYRYIYIYIHFESRPYLHVVQSLASFEPCFRSGAGRCKKKRQEESRTRWMLGICNSPHAAAWLKVYRLPSAAVNPPRLTASMDDGRHRGLGKLVFDKVRALGFRDCLFPCWPFDTQHALAKHFFLDRRSNRATDGCLGALTDCYCELDKRTLNASAHIRDDPVMNGKKI